MREIQNLQSLNLEQLPREVRAHILQAIQDLTGYAQPQTVIGILIKSIGPMPEKTEVGAGPLNLVAPSSPDTALDADPWRISIQVSNENFSVEQEAESADVFSAVSDAKNKMLETLIKINSQVPGASREGGASVHVHLKPETLH